MRRALWVLGVLVVGCIDALDPKQIITGPRVIEVIAEPPEVRPGEPSALTVVLAGTRGEATYRWSVCPVSDLGALGAGVSSSVAECFVDGAALLPLSTAARADFVVPEALIEQATAAARRFESALPAGVLDTFVREVGIAVPVVVEVSVDGQTLRAVKRVVVSRNPTPHRNPPSPRVRLGDRWVSVPTGAADAARCVSEDGAPLRVGPGATMTLTPDPDESWVERYTVLTSDGRFETRAEQAYYSWYATGGSLNALTRSPLRDNEWTLPARAPARGAHSLWVLLRDGHGGASGCRVDLEVAP